MKKKQNSHVFFKPNELLLSDMNVGRMGCCALLLMAAQCLAAIKGMPEALTRRVVWFAGTAAAASFFLCAVIMVLRRPGRSRTGDKLCGAFWLLFPVQSVLLSMSFVPNPTMVWALLLTAMTAATLPVLSAAMSAAVFSVMAVGFLAVSGSRGEPSLAVWSLAAAVAGFALSRWICRQMMHLEKGYQHELNVDYLTGVLNRRGGLSALWVFLDHCRETNRRAAVYMVDIDYFKDYNDRFGHLRGDAVLREVAHGLRRDLQATASRKADGLVCRWGGEEFIVCLALSGEQDAAQPAERFCRHIEELKIPSACRRASEYVTISVGVAVCGPERIGKEHPNSLIDQADAAMYQAKRDGRNRTASFAALRPETAAVTKTEG